MRSLTRCLIALPAVIAASAIGPALGEVLPSDDFGTMLSERWSDAYHSGDAVTLSEVYASDARVQHGYCTPVSGRQAIEDFWRSDFGAGVPETQLLVEDSFMLGDFAYVSGSYKIALSAGVNSPTTGGKYTQIWRRDKAARWSIFRESWINLACADITLHPDDGTDGRSREGRTGQSA